MTENNVEIKIGGNAEGAKTAMDEVSSAVKEALGSMTEGIGSINVAAVALGGIFEHIAETMADALKEMGRSTVEAFAHLGESVEDMQNRIGGSTEGLSELKVALDAAGIGTEQYMSIARRLPQILEQHADKFKAAGVAYKDAEGNLLPVQEQIQNITAYLQQFSAGADRNAAGMELLGRTYFQFADMVKLTSDRLAEGKEVAEQFGLVLSEQDTRATQDFHAETSLLGEAFSGFYVTIGRVLIPILTELAQLVRGPLLVAFEAFKGILFAVQVVLESVMVIFWGLLGVVLQVGVAFNALSQALHGNGNAWEQWKTDASQAVEFVSKKMDEHRKRIGNFLKTPEKTAEGGDHSKAPPEKSKDDGSEAIIKAKAEARYAIIKQALEDENKANEDAHKANLESEQAYWQQKRAIAEAEITAEMNKLKADLTANAAAHQSGEDEKTKNGLIAQRIALEGQLNALMLKRAATSAAIDREEAAAIKKNTDEIAKIKSQHEKAMSELAISQQEETNAELLADGLITDAEMLRRKIVLEQQKYQAALTQLQQEKALYAEGTAKFQEEAAKIEELQAKHSITMQQLNHQLTTSMNKDWDTVWRSISSGFESNFAQMLDGTMTWRKAMQGIFLDVAKAFDQYIARTVTQAIFGENAKTAAAQTGAAARGSISFSESVTSLANVAENAMKAIGTYAVQAFGGVVAFLSPLLGPAALPVAAGVAGAVLAEGAHIASAFGGFDIPPGVNPLTQLHAREMVLPAKHADTIRNLSDGGGVGGDIHVHVHAFDGESVERLLMQKKGTIMEAIKSEVRGFNTFGIR